MADIDPVVSIAMDHARIAIHDAPTKPGFELVPARRTSDDEWELLASPLYAMGVAAGDRIRALDNTGGFEILARGGNVCVQLYLDEGASADSTRQVADALARDLAPLGGRVDGLTPGLISFTIPVSGGLAAIEAAFAAAEARYAVAQWQYFNGYDLVTGEPLGWWV